MELNYFIKKFESFIDKKILALKLIEIHHLFYHNAYSANIY